MPHVKCPCKQRLVGYQGVPVPWDWTPKTRMLLFSGSSSNWLDSFMAAPMASFQAS